MNCTDCQSRLSLRFSQAADEIEDPEIRAHLAQCPACQQEWQELEQLGKYLATDPEPGVAVDLVAIYRQAALGHARSSRRWRWLGMAAGLLLILGGAAALFTRVELRVTGHELAVRWGDSPAAPVALIEPAATSPAVVRQDGRGEQLEVLSAMVRAMLQELQTVEVRQRRDRADMDLRVSGLQEETLKRWLVLQKDLEALYVLTQKGE
jgi:hypothetical protein